MSQLPGPSTTPTLKIEVPWGTTIFEASAKLNCDDLERAFSLNLPTTKLFIMSRHAHRFNQERRGIDLDEIKTSLTYELSKPGLLRAMASNDRSRLQVSID